MQLAAKSDVSKRRELDSILPVGDVEASVAALDELPALHQLSASAIGALATFEIVLRVWKHDPETIIGLKRSGQIVGCCAFLYLNEAGIRALEEGTFDPSKPDLTYLCVKSEKPVALYIWALAATGRAAACIGNAVALLSAGRFSGVDFLTRPMTKAGRRFCIQTGWEPLDEGSGTWRYRRLVNRSLPSAPKRRRIETRIVRTGHEYMQMVALRSAVYMAEQDCPFDEEFDGNDFCSAHIIGYINDAPVGCIRARFFAEFVKLERLAILHQHRKSRMAFMLVKAGIELARRKGFSRIYGHSQDRLTDFWAHFGAKPLQKNHHLVFSDFSYTEMVIELDPHPNPISITSDPYVIIRPEGSWDEPGVLEHSANRTATSPLRRFGE